jgi:NADPH:quinone reductase-like Zn-dependent oxidoreductase
MAGTQKALIVTEIGKPLILVEDRIIAEPGPNQVQVKVGVAGINPHDGKARDIGLIIAGKLPAVLTNDVVGRVIKVGSGVTSISVGDRVVFQSGVTPGYTQNGLQEYAVADIGALAKIPDSITDDEAATLPTNIIAPLVALFDTLQIPAPWSAEAKSFDYASTTLLVVGGGSSCGKFGVQLAKLAGFGNIVVVGGNEDELKGFGATHIIDRHGESEVVLGRIRAIVGDDLIYAYDAVNPPEEQALAINALSNHIKGALARLRPSGPVDETNIKPKQAGYDVRNVFGMSHVHAVLAKEFWDRVPEFLESGKIKPLGYVVKDGLDPATVNAVLDSYRDGKPVTKTHIHL